MPNRPADRCGRCGQPKRGRCRRCLTQTRKLTDNRRGDATTRGYGAEHRDRFRKAVLERDTWCKCGKHRATVADHYPRSRRELEAAGLDPNDPQYGRGLCPSCHNKHTAQSQPGHRFRSDR